MAIQILFLEPEDLTEEEEDQLREQNIEMGDWDFMLCLPGGTIEDVEEKEISGENLSELAQTWKEWHLSPPYNLSRLLPDQYHNIWRRLNFRDQIFDIGITYHA